MPELRSACSHNCWDTCPVDVVVENNRIVSVRGASDNEITMGMCCGKVGLLVDRINDPDRIVKPRVKVRGSWQEISWQEGLDRAGEWLGAVRDRSPYGVLYHAVGGCQSLLAEVDGWFWQLFGGVTRPGGSVCWSAGLAAQREDFGAMRCHDPLDHEQARTVVIWGRNPMETNIHLIPIVNQARKDGCVVVCIDPRRTRTAAWADWHLPVTPGSDYLLAGWLCRTVVEQGWIDHDFIDQHVEGFPRFVEWLSGLPGDDVLERKTGVSSTDVLKLARCYRSGGPVATMVGYGMQRYGRGGLAVRLIDAVAGITGNVGIAGGGVSYAGGYVRESLIPSWGGNERWVRWPDLVNEVAAADPAVEMMVVARSNPAVQLPDVSRTRAMLMGMEKLIVIDNRWTETAELADLFLPCTVSFENEDVFHSSWHNMVTYGERVVEPPLGLLSGVEIWSELANRLGFGEQLPGDGRWWLKRMLQPLDSLRVSCEPGSTFRYPGAPMVPFADGFMTESGKMRLPDGDGWSGDSDDGLWLISPKEARALHSQGFERVENGELCRVLMSEAAAGERGVAAGDVVDVVSDVGKMRCVVGIDAGLRDDVVVVYPGGNPEEGKCVNVVTGYRGSDIGDCVAYYDCRVEVRKG